MQRFKLNGKYLNLLFVHYRKGFYGHCDHPRAKPREVWVDRRLGGRRLLEFAIHEVIHAWKWDLTERQVKAFARDLARLIDRLGYKECPHAREERKRKAKQVWKAKEPEPD